MRLIYRSLSSGDPELTDEKLIGMLKLASSVGQLLKRYSSWTLTQKNVASITSENNDKKTISSLLVRRNIVYKEKELIIPL